VPAPVQAPSPTRESPPVPSSGRPWRWSAGTSAGILAVLALWSLVPLTLLFVAVSEGLSFGTEGRVFTGVDGPGISDQLQYMSWVRDAGENVVFSNRFDLGSDPHLFFHPMFALSGLLWKLGASVQLSFLVWKPVAVLVLFIGFSAYVRRLVDADPWLRGATLFLALFLFTPAAWLFDWAGIGGEGTQFSLLVMAVEMFPGAFVWGLWPLAVSVGLMPVFLLCLERIVVPAERRPGRSAAWYAAGAAAAGLVVAWAHPWQGLILLVITGALIAWGGLWRRALLAVPVAATAAPIAYYYVLTRTDSAWAAVAELGGHPHLGSWFFLALVPPLLLAAVGVPGRDLDLQERALRLWPLAALLVYFALDTSWIYHAFGGLSLPLAILAVRGWRRLGAPRAVLIGAVAALTLPGMVFYVQEFRRSASDHFIERGEAAAIEHVDRSPRGGGVLTSYDLGRHVPALSGRNTWVGHFTWTPEYGVRLSRTEQLFSGRMEPAQAQGFVRSTRAAFLLSGCERPDLRPVLGPLVASSRSFGCARLYEITPAA
jgi:hypothetical protein